MKLIMTRGLPGSGKSFWAENQKGFFESQGLKVFISTKDDIRKKLSETGWQWSKDAEKDVILKQNSDIKNAFMHGNHVVIVADTNFGKHKNRLMDLAKRCGAEFEVKDFTNVSVEVCIERDAGRPKDQQVGPEVIKQMHNKYLAVQDVKPYVPDTQKPPAIIVDLDGTIALHVNRSPYDISKVDTDKLNEPVAEIVKLYAKIGYTILYTSGREDTCRFLTENWLAVNRMPVDSPHMLIMRQAKDTRKDYIVKQELFDNYIRDHYNVKFVLDDRNQVVAMWRRLGLTCLQVADGAF